MDAIKDTLERFGLSPKASLVYLTLLSAGPSSIRKIADQTRLNRGTTYVKLKDLRRLGLVSYYHKETRQYFVAEHPKAFLEVMKQRRADLRLIENNLHDIIPQLSLRQASDSQPVVKYYEGSVGSRTILQDVLDTTGQLPRREYAVYSSANIRRYLYAAYQNFTAERERLAIAVKVIAIGSGGQEAKLAERRWLTKQTGAPTYQLIYANKIALISVSAGDAPRGIIMEDAATAQTQRLIFDQLWRSLPA